ncbi:MAG TPA: PDZ domain-containing protein [Verrucomicrobiae bacterium]|nr:PDZ domain-containing protein [Verrucomicrobiae bacterium]
MRSFKRIVAVAALFGAAVAAPAGEAAGGDSDARAQRRAREAVMRDLEDQLRAAQLQMKDAARRLAELQVQLDTESPGSGAGAGSGHQRARAFVWRGTGGPGSASGSGDGGSWSTSWSGSWGNRAVLGVVVRTADDGAGGAEGAKLEAITPGGPAEQAGLKAGDVITSIQGVSLARKPGEARVRARDDADEDPAERDADADEARRLYASALLIREVGKLHDGDKVAIEYLRGRDKRTATVVAREIPTTFKMIGPMAPLGEPGTRIEINSAVPPVPTAPAAPATPEALSSAMLAAIAPLGTWSQMELVALNPDLGSYFSTDRGVLVVSAPRDGALKLKGGDVILQVDGESAESPSSAMRLLRFGRASEPVQILVLRKGQKLTVTTEPAAVPAPAPRPRRVAAPRAPAPPPPPPPKPGGAGNDL